MYFGLSTIADRAGRLEDRPRRIKAEVLPHDACDTESLLAQLHKHGLILRYTVDGSSFIEICDWEKNQSPHLKEPVSTIPTPEKTGPGTGSEQVLSGSSTELAPDKQQTNTAPAALIPDSPFLIPDSRVGAAPAAPPPAAKSKNPKTGSRLPDDWTLPDDYRAFCTTERPDLDPQKVADKFADHWRGKAGRDGVKLDWLSAFRNWVRNERETEQRMSGGNRGAGHPDSRASVEAEAEAKGIKPWDEMVQWPEYLARVRAAPEIRQ